MDKVNINTIKEVFEAPCNPNIIMIDDIRRVYDIPSQQMLIEGFVFVVVLQGSAHVIVDNVEYELHRGDVFGCNPRNILEKSMMSMDLQVMGFFVTEEYASHMLPLVHLDWSFLIMIKAHEILHASDQELERLVMYMNLLRAKLEAGDSKHSQESIDTLLLSMGYEIYDIRQRLGEPCRQTDYSPGENLVQRFVMMLAESGKQGKPYLNVNGYAQQLNVSSKYFSLVCKKVLGKTASELINEAIISSAKVMLKDNSLSIKQIASRLGFANQSHFGTYFSRKTGMSPQQFRNSNARIQKQQPKSL